MSAEITVRAGDWPEDRADDIAGGLCADSLAWARTIMACAHREGTALEDALLDEILSYALWLVQPHLNELGPKRASSFHKELRRQCRGLTEERAWRRRNARSRLPAPQPTSEHSQFTQRYLEASARQDPTAGLSPESFEEFCRLTGLASAALVGEGDNLASLIFYIVVHGVVSRDGALPRQQAADVLRAASRCRDHFQTTVRQCVSSFVSKLS